MRRRDAPISRRTAGRTAASAPRRRRLGAPWVLARIWASRAWKPSSSVRNSQPPAAFAARFRSGRPTVSRSSVRVRERSRLRLRRIGGEITFERAADLVAVVAQARAGPSRSPSGSIALGQRRRRPEDRPPARPEDPPRPAERRGTPCRPRRPRPCAGLRLIFAGTSIAARAEASSVSSSSPSAARAARTRSRAASVSVATRASPCWFRWSGPG